MIKFVLGPSGSGKTKWLIDEANKDKREGLGNIVFIDSDDSHIFSLDHKVRLINARDFDIVTIERFYGFLSGIISRDYDIEKIYVDGIYEIVDLDKNSISTLADGLNLISEKCNVDFFIGLNKSREEIESGIKAEIVEVEL